MKIIHVPIRYWPAIGGVENYVRQICEGCVRRGYQIDVYTSNLEQHARRVKLKDYKTSENINGVEVFRFNSKYMPIPSQYPLLESLASKLLSANADLIHGHCFYYFTGDVSSLIAKIRRKPFVFNPYFYHRNSWKWRFYQKVMGRMLFNADAVIIISEFEKLLIEKEGFQIKRFELIPPAVDPTEFEIETEDVYSKFSIDTSKKRVVLFVGRVDTGKGIDTLIQAGPQILKNAPETVFFIVGPDWGNKEEYENLVHKLKLQNDVVFAGSLTRKELLSAYKNATLLVLPSRYEAFGIVMIEALAAGIPVVASNTSALPYVIDHEKTGILVTPNDPSALAEGVIRLLKDEKLCAEMGSLGREVVLKKYTMKLQQERLENLYQSLSPLKN